MCPCFIYVFIFFYIIFFFFFFQAEDGIRDLTVTGVQTCALPIWLRFVPIAIEGMPVDEWLARLPKGTVLTGATSYFAGRSEERRVGKECRSRWSSYQ